MAELLINGIASQCVDPADRGIHYGDGVFETIRIHDGRPSCWARHLARLQEGCRRLGLEAPAGAALGDEATGLCREIRQGVLKIIVTRGPGGRGYRAPARPHPTRIVSVHPLPDYPAAFSTKGVTVRLCHTRWSTNPALAGIKHLNRLEQVLARSEWDDPDIAEGLMLNTDDEVISGTMSNLFVVDDGAVRTPGVERSGIAGVTRGRVLEIAARLDIGVNVGSLDLEQVRRADELFLCNSVIGIWPIRRLENRTVPVGRITRRLQRALADAPDD